MMKYLIIAFSLISFFSCYNCQFIKKLEQKKNELQDSNNALNFEWFITMVNSMLEQMQGRQLTDMDISPDAPCDEFIDDLLYHSNIIQVTCIKLLTYSDVIDRIEIEVVKKDGKSYAIQISTKDKNLAVVTKPLASQVKNNI
uniref:Venom protein Ci-14b n=1 Tax=Chelonus inanitus TaxID=49201 RepID=E6ZCI9_9HYME|nr:venom protein Ci-14b [Chelonus inanitus]